MIMGDGGGGEWMEMNTRTKEEMMITIKIINSYITNYHPLTKVLMANLKSIGKEYS